MTEITRAERIAARIIELKAQEDDIAEAIKNLRASLAEEVDEGDNFVGEFKINRRENRRFDAAVAKKNLDEDQLKLISVSKPDSALAKAHLSEADLAKCQKNFGTVVTVTVRND